MKKFFITSSGTEVGKTFVTAALCRQLLDKSYKIKAIKPVISGWDDTDTDTHILLEAQGLAATPQNMDNCSPWRFNAPLSPDMAARLENREVDFDEVVAFCNKAAEKDKTLLIEGAGGVMSPLTENKTNLDLINALKPQVLLVVGTYLGSISHTLTALKALENNQVAIILNESENAPVSLEEVERSLKNFCNNKIIKIRRNAKISSDLFGFM